MQKMFFDRNNNNPTATPVDMNMEQEEQAPSPSEENELGLYYNGGDVEDSAIVHAPNKELLVILKHKNSKQRAMQMEIEHLKAEIQQMQCERMQADGSLDTNSPFSEHSMPLSSTSSSSMLSRSPLTTTQYSNSAAVTVEAVQRAREEVEAEAAERYNALQSRFDLQYQERCALKTILESKMKTLADSIAANLLSSSSPSNVSARTKKELEVLQTLIDASLAALKHSDSKENNNGNSNPTPSATPRKQPQPETKLQERENVRPLQQAKTSTHFTFSPPSKANYDTSPTTTDNDNNGINQKYSSTTTTTSTATKNLPPTQSKLPLFGTSQYEPLPLSPPMR